MKKGFTLIELLVVIAIMAVISSAVLVAIDPVDKIRAANDARAQADVGQVATALTAYAASNDGAYPATGWASLSVLVTTGELTRVPTPPTGYTYDYVNSGGVTPTITLTSTLLSKKYTSKYADSTAFWMWCNTSSAASDVDNSNSACP